MIINFDNFLLEYNISGYNIDNLKSYFRGMSEGLQDKLFFMDKIKNMDVIVDFGCANGYILQQINKISPHIKLIGYDIDEKMLSSAEKNLHHTNITLVENWKLAESIISQYINPTLLLSSVIHEVYSYSNNNKNNYFWNNQVFNDKFKYVVIRDMMPSLDYYKFNMSDVDKIRSKSDTKYLSQFENRWGSIDDDFKTLLHWILKYRFTDNWDRELNENYLPLTIETLKSKIPKKWKIVHEEHYVLPFLQKTIMNDFGVNLNQPTHIKMILKNEK